MDVVTHIQTHTLTRTLTHMLTHSHTFLCIISASLLPSHPTPARKWLIAVAAEMEKHGRAMRHWKIWIPALFASEFEHIP